MPENYVHIKRKQKLPGACGRRHREVFVSFLCVHNFQAFSNVSSPVLPLPIPPFSQIHPAFSKAFPVISLFFPFPSFLSGTDVILCIHNITSVPERKEGKGKNREITGKAFEKAGCICENGGMGSGRTGEETLENA